MITVFIANESYLLREGIKVLIKKTKGLKTVGEATSYEELETKVFDVQPDILLVDYANEAFTTDAIGHLKNFIPNTKYLAITSLQSKSDMAIAIEAGVHSHVLNICSAEEIIEALFETASGAKFLCGTILERVFDNNRSSVKSSNANCEPVKISTRELEIVRLIAEGFTNKEIGDRLFISTHTVMTHRKNIMNKLGINNTAGLVIYAVQEKLISPDQFIFDSTVH
ncbi:MAG: response regulator transcription factor [Flavobacteriales bacterium]|nr:response regulator transcription factor [Flavobacteriales bacterium]